MLSILMKLMGRMLLMKHLWFDFRNIDMAGWENGTDARWEMRDEVMRTSARSGVFFTSVLAELYLLDWSD